MLNIKLDFRWILIRNRSEKGIEEIRKEFFIELILVMPFLNKTNSESVVT